MGIGDQLRPAKNRLLKVQITRTENETFELIFVDYYSCSTRSTFWLVIITRNCGPKIANLFVCSAFSLFDSKTLTLERFGNFVLHLR